MKISTYMLIFVAINFILIIICSFNIIASILLSFLFLVLLNTFNSFNSYNNQIAEHKNENETEKDKIPRKQSYDEIIKFSGIRARKNTEAYRVQAEVIIRKEIAKKKKVDILISNLYMNHIKHYPHWINKDRLNVPAIVSSAIETRTKDKVIDIILGEDPSDIQDSRNTEAAICIILNNKKFKFIFTITNFAMDSEYYSYGLLELFENSKKVLGINHSLLRDGYDELWDPYDIEAFIDGEWVEDFYVLQREIKELEKIRLQEESEDPNETERLKRNFGI